MLDIWKAGLEASKDTSKAFKADMNMLVPHTFGCFASVEKLDTSNVEFQNIRIRHLSNVALWIICKSAFGYDFDIADDMNHHVKVIAGLGLQGSRNLIKSISNFIPLYIIVSLPCML